MNLVVLDRASMGLDIPFEKLKTFGNLAVFNETQQDNIIERIRFADVIIVNKIKLTRDLLKNAESLKLITVFATGYDNIDLSYAKERGIAVCNVPAYSTDSVTLFTFATALSLITNIRQYSEYVRCGEYSISGIANKIEPVFHNLSGKTWGIIGLGNIGKNVAKVARAFGADIIAFTRTHNSSYDCVTLDELCKKSDIISIHCPLNEQTRNMINKEKISLMKNDVILINEARGAVVSEIDVKNAILNKEIAAFGCDVYSEEPFTATHPYYLIKDLDNVLLTPHSAWASFEARSACLDVIASNIQSFLSGEMLNRVDWLN